MRSELLCGVVGFGFRRFPNRPRGGEGDGLVGEMNSIVFFDYRVGKGRGGSPFLPEGAHSKLPPW